MLMEGNFMHVETFSHAISSLYLKELSPLRQTYVQSNVKSCNW